MENIFLNKKMSIAVRNRMLKSFLEPILFDAYGTWSRTRQAEKHAGGGNMVSGGKSKDTISAVARSVWAGEWGIYTVVVQ